MKIALYHPWIYLKSGLERTILEIAKRSRHEWVIYTSHFDAQGTYPELKNYGVREVNRVSVQRSYGAVLGASWRIASTQLDLSQVQALVVCCDGLGSFITLRNASRPIVNLCFTPLRAVYDLEYRQRHLGRQGGRRGLALLLEAAYKTIDRWVWKRYQRIICISQTVKDRSQAGGLLGSQPVDVMYPGIDVQAVQASDRFEEIFFIPGRIMWTKNIELGIAAFLQFKKVTGSPHRLVIAGMVDAKSQSYLKTLRDMAGHDQGVEFHLSPSDAEMRDYYNRCSAMLFTAFNEDLGLTPMEAMASGKPVIAVDKGGPQEVVEHQVTGYLVPADPNSFAVTMELLVSDPQKMRRMGAAGLERVQRFGWDYFVKQLDDVLDTMGATAGS
ncbi:MAG: glycosyltransferase family 1 protein [Burkholderiaceae bacterium]|jgi:glycosyltransferase involved in cell wall biosynthesis|uniref:glycosyltransferase n=1 Tax=Ottowia thiooxydans TaxID=219182 RepID=UPI00041948EA|nr:glycosyltransferase [Ottowia thiooxydans]TXH35863.1 MAG: glycosyltransferase family 1 protein [Burkholderiaceae bacterium]